MITFHRTIAADLALCALTAAVTYHKPTNTEAYITLIIIICLVAYALYRDITSERHRKWPH